MPIPNENITPIPDTEPDATPDLWNARYTEIDENFANLDQRTGDLEDEIQNARGGKPSVGAAIAEIITHLGGINATLTGLASPASLQNAVTLDWLYAGRQILFELFADGFRLQNTQGVAVTTGIMGDDTLEIADTNGLKVGEDYLLVENNLAVLKRVKSILNATRLRLTTDLARDWGPTTIITGSTLQARPDGGADAPVGAQWISRAINLGDNNTSRAVIIRRTLNAGEVRLYFRDAFTKVWTERTWSVRRSGGGTSGIPEGYVDDEYLVPLRGDGYLRLVTEGEDMVIKHIVGLNAGTGLGGSINPLMRPTAPAIANPANGTTNIGERPTLTAAGYSSPAGNSFAQAQFQISTDSAFATVLHDTGEVGAMTSVLGAGVLNQDTVYYLRARVKDVAGLVSDWSAISSFTTKAAFVAYVNTPVVTLPTQGQSEIPEQPTLQTSAFATTGSTDTHQSSQWQIRLDSGNWDAPLHDSGASTTAKTSYTVPAGVLSGGQTQYVMRVRHTGTTLGASEWSSDIAFTTKQQFANIIGIASTGDGGGAGTWQRIDENYNPITTNVATFNNHPVYAGVVGQTIDGQAMIKVPKFWFKGGLVPSGPYAGKPYWMISDRATPGFSVHPAFMSAGSAIAQFWVGKYQATNDGGSKIGSAAGQQPLVSISLDTFKARSAARNIGGVTGFALWDVYQLAAIQALALIEMGGSDSQALIGNGNVSTAAALPVNHATVAQASWRGIVGLWGNVHQFLDGLQLDADKHYKIWDNNGNHTYQTTAQVCPASGYTMTTATDSGTDYDLHAVFVPSSTNALASNGSTGDILYSGSANCICFVGGFWASGSDAGLFSVGFSVLASTPLANIGGRLAKI